MNLIPPILFAISANTDNLIVGISYGINKIKINKLSNLIISLITVTGTFLSMSLSKFIVLLIPTGFSAIIGGLMLIFIGTWTILKPFIYKAKPPSVLNNPENIDKDNSKDIDSKEAVTLALALSINNVGLGVGASITGLNIISTSLSTFALSLLMIRIGCFLGTKYISKLMGQKSEFVSGLIIIFLGLITILF